jgi:hypothetical protein
MATQHGQRLVFDNAKALVKNAGFDVNQAILSQSYLRSEVAMSTSTTSYHVPILVNDSQNGNAFATENRLNLQDAFVVSSIGVFVSRPAASTTTAFQYYTYPNAVAFSTAGAADALYNLYNGSMSVVVNNRQIIPSWDLYRHLFVPQFQQGTSSSATNGGIDENDAAEFGYYPAEPNIVFVGSKNNQISLNLPSAIGTLQATTAPRIVVIFRGILAQNVTPVR